MGRYKGTEGVASTGSPTCLARLRGLPRHGSDRNAHVGGQSPSGWFLRLKGNTCFKTEWFLKLLPMDGAAGFIAVIAGWTTTEVGRQPWTVYGLSANSKLDLARTDGRRRVGLFILYVAVYLLMLPNGAFLCAGHHSTWRRRRSPAGQAHCRVAVARAHSRPRGI